MWWIRGSVVEGGGRRFRGGEGDEGGAGRFGRCVVVLKGDGEGKAWKEGGGATKCDNSEAETR